MIDIKLRLSVTEFAQLVGILDGLVEASTKQAHISAPERQIIETAMRVREQLVRK